MNKETCLKCILIFTLVFVSSLLTVTLLQDIVFADVEGSGWIKGDSSKGSSFGEYEGYTRVISTLLIVIALIIATVYVLKKKYGVRTTSGRNKKLIQIIDHVPMGVKKSVFLVSVAGKHLLLGVTSDNIGLISEVAIEDTTGASGGGTDEIDRKEFLNIIKKSISERKQR